MRCKNRDEAEKITRSIVGFITKPGLICMDLEDVRKVAVIGNHEAKLWLLESFDDEPVEEFMARIKDSLPPLASRSFMLQVEGDIGLMVAYDLAQLITDLSSEDANIMFLAQCEGIPGYMALFVFAVEVKSIGQEHTGEAIDI